MTKKRSMPARTIATIKCLPYCYSIVKNAIKEAYQRLVAEAAAEVEYRRTIVNLMTD